MNTATNRTRQNPKEIQEELRSLVREAEDILARSTEGCCEATMAELRERLTAAQTRLADLYDRARRKVVAGAHSTDEAIRENPYRALAIAAGVGLLAGVLLSHYNSRD